MLYTSQNCSIYSRDPLLIGELIIAGHTLHYESELESLVTHLSETHPDLVIIDTTTSLAKNDIDTLIHTSGYIIIRGSIGTEVVSSLEKGKIFLFPSDTPSVALIEKIAHIHESVNHLSGKAAPEILIIEDNTDILDMYTIAFESRGYHIHTATDGLRGITEAARLHPDIIILDIMMPHMDGFEVLHTLRHNTAIRPIIIVNSNLEGVDEEKRVRELGADHFLKKSQYTPLEVVSYIEKAILRK